MAAEQIASAQLAEARRVIVDHYDLGETAVEPFTGGIINSTYLVEGDGTRGLLQKLHPMFPPEVNDDFVAVTDHLRAEGWEAPALLPTRDNSTYTAVEGAVWRVMTFIDSDPGRPEPFSDTNYHDFGAMLGRFHGTLAKLEYSPAYHIPHFHETDYYAARMEAVKDALPDQETRQVASDMLIAVRSLPEIPLSESQIIHGDPQTSNSLFRDGKPLTFIDYDTIMEGPIWTDIGDMLRSIAEDVVESGGGFPMDRLRLVAEGYRQVAVPNVAADEFMGWALTAVQKISLELGMRFITDLAPGEDYFGFDPTKFSSREASNYHRGFVQWQLYQAARQHKEELA